MTTSDLSKEHLLNPAIMLETFDIAYRYVLDDATLDSYHRITPEEQHELGRRLATYSLWAREQRKGLTEHRET